MSPGLELSLELIICKQGTLIQCSSACMYNLMQISSGMTNIRYPVMDGCSTAWSDFELTCTFY